MGYSFTVLRLVFVPTFGNEFGPFVYDRVTDLNDVKFKQRFTNHNQSFRHEKYSNSTEL